MAERNGFIAEFSTILEISGFNQNDSLTGTELSAFDQALTGAIKIRADASEKEKRKLKEKSDILDQKIDDEFTKKTQLEQKIKANREQMSENEKNINESNRKMEKFLDDSSEIS